MNAVLILNPAAGRSRPALLRERIERVLQRCGLDCEIWPTGNLGDGTVLARRAVEQGAEIIIAGGGDGTVNAVVSGMAGTGATLGIIPLGTVNVLARELRIPLNTRKAVRAIIQGNVKNIDLGAANGRYFTLMAGFGFDAEVVANVVQPLKDVLGATAYVVKGLETLAKYQPTEFTLEMPDESYSGRAYVVIVANSSTYAYKMKIAPHASSDDGLLDILVFEQPVSMQLGFVRQILEIFIRRHIYHKRVRYFKTSSVIVRSAPETMAQLDGDPFGNTPVAISVSPRALPIIVP